MLAIKKLTQEIDELDTLSFLGKVKKVSGEIIETNGPKCSLHELAELIRPEGKVMMELVGFNRQGMQFMPYQSIKGIQEGDLIRSLGYPLQVKIGHDLIGRVVDFAGHPLDSDKSIKGTSKNVFRQAPNLLKRKLINKKLETGIKAIDALLTIGQGQRMGIFSGPGVGKSILLSMIAKYSQADVNVISLVGERGREVKEFIERHLGPEGMKKSIVVVSTSDDPPLARIRNLFTATSIAEYFRDEGMNVLLMMDSITRLAQSQRELSISLKEPPISRGYPPSLFNLLPQLLERTGRGETGSITGIYTVLVEGDDLEEPISDAMRGLLDGHIILSRKLADRGHYPAIDISQSVSRLMIDLVDKDHFQAAQKIREWLSIYSDMEDLIQMGAYATGSNPILDTAIAKQSSLNQFIRQTISDHFSADQSSELMFNLVK